MMVRRKGILARDQFRLKGRRLSRSGDRRPQQACKPALRPLLTSPHCAPHMVLLDLEIWIGG